MGIFSRFQDIVNSNLTALLDRAEDPKKMIRQMIQEMEDTLIEVRSTSAKLIADRKELQRHIELLHKEASDWLKKTELAISKGREDLAKGALLEKRRAEEAAETNTNELNFLNQQLEVLNDEIGQLQSKLEAAKAKQKELLIREQTGQSRLDIRRQTSKETLNRAFDKFEQYERRLDDLEGQVEAYDMGNSQKTSLADEIEELAVADDIQQELEAIKSKMHNQSEQDAER